MFERNFKLYVLIFVFGAVGYTIVELLWRGRTHWTMALAGGTCFVLIYFMNSQIETSSFVLKCFIACAMITAVEFIFGCIVNLALGWGVWDYSGVPFNLLGQVCLYYTLLWFLLSIPLVKICETIDLLLPIRTL